MRASSTEIVLGPEIQAGTSEHSEPLPPPCSPAWILPDAFSMSGPGQESRGQESYVSLGSVFKEPDQ